LHDLALDPAVEEALRRVTSFYNERFRATEAWANRPHTTWGSRTIQPVFYGEDTGTHVFTAQASGDDFTDDAPPTVGTDVFEALTVSVDRPSRAFVWTACEWENTSGSSYRTLLFSPVTWNATRDNGRAVAEYQQTGTGARRQLCNIRDVFIDVDAPTDVRFEWGWKVAGAGDQQLTVYRQKMIAWVFDGAGVKTTEDVTWTSDAPTVVAFRNPEGTDT
jgi:hypothetical protein